MVVLVVFSEVLGVCQGDPLSLMLFEIVMEALSKKMHSAMSSGHLLGFMVGTSANQLMVSHLLVDDMLIF